MIKVKWFQTQTHTIKETDGVSGQGGGVVTETFMITRSMHPFICPVCHNADSHSVHGTQETPWEERHCTSGSRRVNEDIKVIFHRTFLPEQRMNEMYLNVAFFPPQTCTNGFFFLPGKKTSNHNAALVRCGELFRFIRLPSTERH